MYSTHMQKANVTHEHNGTYTNYGTGTQKSIQHDGF